MQFHGRLGRCGVANEPGREGSSSLVQVGKWIQRDWEVLMVRRNPWQVSGTLVFERLGQWPQFGHRRDQETLQLRVVGGSSFEHWEVENLGLEVCQDAAGLKECAQR